MRVGLGQENKGGHRQDLKEEQLQDRTRPMAFVREV